LLIDSQLRAQMGKRGREWVLGEWGWEAQAILLARLLA
jgi:hypothetical protein